MMGQSAGQGDKSRKYHYFTSEVGLDDGAPWHVSGRAVGAHAPRHGTSAGGLSELRDNVVADLVNCETTSS